MSKEPSAIVFDVNETLSDMAPMAARFDDVGAPGLLARVWFASLLRDGFALAAAGSAEKFAVIADGVLRDVLRGVELNREVEDAVNHVLDGLSQLTLHPDVPEGVRALATGGYRLTTLTNGGTTVADTLLSSAGLRDQFEALLSVEDGVAWKPVASSYDRAAAQLGLDPSELLLVAVHPWDIHGAARAGLHTAWLNRSDADYPRYFAQPDFTAASLGELARLLPPVPGR